jgi:hypothetical protein
MFLLSIEIKMQQKTKNKINVKKIWGRHGGCGWGATSHKSDINKTCPQTLNPTPFEGRFGRRG